MSYILSQKEVKTRTEHKCFGCGREFPRNTKMLRESVKDDIVFTVYLCPTCQHVSQSLSWNDEFGEGDLYDSALEFEAERGNHERRKAD